ncbi:thiamine pyrophosphate-binding protein, partial [Planctomycetaceae bacterium]|nr:thiamine pyrophosphate-binding protein [Planctomycetaceae bacterium]
MGSNELRLPAQKETAVATIEKSTETRTLTGADILVESLIHQGVSAVFAYPGGASMPLHQALRLQRDNIRTVLPRHEQGGGFAAQGVSRTSDE